MYRHPTHVPRYPTFDDALHDLDDALCMVALFANMPQTDLVQAERVARCNRLMHEFMLYIVHTKALRKAFLSIKGYVCHLSYLMF